LDLRKSFLLYILEELTYKWCRKVHREDLHIYENFIDFVHPEVAAEQQKETKKQKKTKNKKTKKKTKNKGVTTRSQVPCFLQLHAQQRVEWILGKR